MKSFNILNCNYSFPFLNDSIVSDKVSTHFPHPIVTSHRHHQGAAALTARNFRREKIRDGNLKCLSKDMNLFDHNTSVESILSNSNQLLKSKRFISNSNLNKSSLTFPIKSSGKFVFLLYL